MSDPNKFVRIAENPTDTYDLSGTFDTIPFVPITIKRGFSHCICNGALDYFEVIQCKSCGAKCHAECYKIKPDQQQYFICISCQQKMADAIITQITTPLNIIQQNINDISCSFDELCQGCEENAPTTFEESVSLEHVQSLHSSITKLLGDAAFRWNNAVSQIKKIQNLVSGDLFFDSVPKPPHDNNDS